MLQDNYICYCRIQKSICLACNASLLTKGDAVDQTWLFTCEQTTPQRYICSGCRSIQILPTRININLKKYIIVSKGAALCSSATTEYK